ncbi:hypothetical protein VN12_26895 [Pirellula sp. SH-Sr6A]|nr:hypothetical protein VN12_26895 [Pirellula sp. SH-Sr6A]
MKSVQSYRSRIFEPSILSQFDPGCDAENGNSVELLGMLVRTGISPCQTKPASGKLLDLLRAHLYGRNDIE